MPSPLTGVPELILGPHGMDKAGARPFVGLGFVLPGACLKCIVPSGGCSFLRSNILGALGNEAIHWRNVYLQGPERQGGSA